MKARVTKKSKYLIFAQELRLWRGNRSQARAAADLMVPLATFQAWEQARQKPQGYVMDLLRFVMLQRLPEQPQEESEETALTAAAPAETMEAQTHTLTP